MKFIHILTVNMNGETLGWVYINPTYIVTLSEKLINSKKYTEILLINNTIHTCRASMKDVQGFINS